MLMMFSSIKFRLIGFVITMSICMLAISPLIGTHVEKSTISAFEDQAKREQSGLLKRIVANHFEGLGSWMRPWMTSQNLAPLLEEEVNKEQWESTLLGIGNQISVAFGVNQILSYNFDGEQLYDYRVSKNDPHFSTNKEKLDALIEEAIENEAIVSGFIDSDFGARMFVLGLLGEDEDGELATINLFVGGVVPILKEFQNSTTYFSELNIGGKKIKSDENFQLSAVQDGVMVDVDKNEYIVRNIKLESELFGAPASLGVFVNTTKLNQEFKKTREMMYGASGLLLLIFLPIFIGVVFFLLRPLSNIVSVTKDIAEGHYDRRVNIKEKSEIGELAVSFNQMVSAIQDSDSNLKSLLAGLNDGIFFFDKEGSIAKERSQALEKILPSSEHINHINEFMAKYTEVNTKDVKFVLECLWDDSGFLNPFEGTVAMLPSKLTVDAEDGMRTIHLQYKELLDTEGQLDKVIVFVSDVTQKLKIENHQRMQAERIKRISMAAGNLESFKEFFLDAIKIFKRVDGVYLGSEALDLASVNRDLHTLKGNTATFEFTTLANNLHDLEDAIEKAGAKSMITQTQSKWEMIKDQWKFETTDIEEVLGLHKNDYYIRVDRFKVASLKKHEQVVKNQELRDKVEDLERYPIADIFKKYERMMTSLAQKSDKSINVVYAEDSDQLTFKEIQSVDTALVHIFRNSVDHGIEKVFERSDLGKLEEGVISIGCYRKDSHIHLTIKDDGKGIDTERLVEKAVNNGIYSREEAGNLELVDKINLIFAASLSTAESVTSTSGRGVGMDAVKSHIEEMGGRISVYSEMGSGSQFEIDFPVGNKNSLKVA